MEVVFYDSRWDWSKDSDAHVRRSNRIMKSDSCPIPDVGDFISLNGSPYRVTERRFFVDKVLGGTESYVEVHCQLLEGAK